MSTSYARESFFATPAGPRRTAPENFRYIGAAECDRMAQLAWLELERRVANSDGSAFINDGESRICVWRQPV